MRRVIDIVLTSLHDACVNVENRQIEGKEINMRTQHLHHKPVASELLYANIQSSFVPMHLTIRPLNDDSCWDEYETEYAEESLPNHIINYFDEAAGAYV